MQSQCSGKEKKKSLFCLCIFCPSDYPWKKSQVVSLTVGTLLVLLQTWSPWYKKIAFCWGHRVSHVSADRALVRVKGHSATTNCAVQHPLPARCPQSSSFLFTTFSWSRPLRLRMKPVNPASCGESDGRGVTKAPVWWSFHNLKQYVTLEMPFSNLIENRVLPLNIKTTQYNCCYQVKVQAA